LAQGCRPAPYFDCVNAFDMSCGQCHALVAGATGVAGSDLTRHLLRLEQWRVTALCHTDRPLDGVTKGGRLSVLPDVDLAAESRAAIDAALATVNGVTHVFYCAWGGEANVHTLNRSMPNAGVRNVDAELALAPASERDEAEGERNLRMLRNVVEATEAVHGATLRRVVLLHGTQWYGVHLGPDGVFPREYKTPFEEDDRRPCWCWYNVHEDWARQRRRGGSHWSWVALRPSTIIGRGLGSPMNLGTGMAVLFALFKEAGGCATFPGTRQSYDALTEATSAELLAQMMVWAAESTTEACIDESFNCVNGDVFRWRYLWPRLATACGVAHSPPPADGTKGPSVAELVADKRALWGGIVRRYGLVDVPLDALLPGAFLDAVFNRNWDAISSMNKARSADFCCTEDTVQTYLTLFHELANVRVVPPLLVVAPYRWGRASGASALGGHDSSSEDMVQEPAHHSGAA